MTKPTIMKAMTYYGADDARFEKRPIPVIIDPTDAIIRMTKTTICRTDLGICKGKNPEIEATARAKTGKRNGRILGHEGVGVVEETVRRLKTSKRAIKSSSRACLAVARAKIAKNSFTLIAVLMMVVGLWGLFSISNHCQAVQNYCLVQPIG